MSARSEARAAEYFASSPKPRPQGRLRREALKKKKKQKAKPAEAHHIALNKAAQTADSKTGTAAPTVATSHHERHGDRTSGEDAAPSPVGQFLFKNLKNAAPSPVGQWLRFRDLKASGLVSSWAGVIHLVETAGFPCGRLLGPNVRIWEVREIQEWLDARPTERGRKAGVGQRDDDQDQDQDDDHDRDHDIDHDHDRDHQVAAPPDDEQAALTAS
jgi:hypothetical protein